MPVAARSPANDDDRLDEVFFALSDPVRRAILDRLNEGPLLVSEIAGPFAITLQAVSRHIQVLVRAGLVTQALRGAHQPAAASHAEPLADAAAWINRYAKYWQAQFEALAAHLIRIEEDKP